MRRHTSRSESISSDNDNISVRVDHNEFEGESMTGSPVPIHWRSRKYLRFCIKGQTFQFKALPFGLATSPFVFTRLMVTIATHLRRRSVVLFPYLDNWLVRNQIRADILRDQQFTIKLISSLGLIINEKKSDLIPAQNFVFIGMEFLTHKNIVRVPWDRVQDILSLVLWFKKQEQVSARLFLSLLGKLSAAAQFVVLGRLHLRPLQMALFAQWKPHVLPLEHCILINMQSRVIWSGGTAEKGLPRVYF